MTLLGNGSAFVERVVKQVKGLADPSSTPPVLTLGPRIIGHRGSPQKAAENTLYGAQLAIDEGAQGVEVDVCVTSDGHVVIWHDRDPDDWVSVARQSGLESCAYTPYAPEVGNSQRKRICELSLEEFVATHGYKLADPDLARTLGLPCPETLPAEPLDPLVHWIADDERVHELILDVKLTPDEEHLSPKLLDHLERLQITTPHLSNRSVKLLTPQREIYETLRAELEQRTRLSMMVVLVADFERPGVVATAREIGARDVSIGITTSFLWPSVREEVMEALVARARGELDSVTVWTANREEELRELLAANVDSVLTDGIPLAIQTLQSLQERANPQAAVNA